MEQGIVIVFLAVCMPAMAGKLPDYIIPCKADNTLNECSLRNGREVIPKIIKGDPKFRIPRLDPLLISKLAVNQGTSQVGLNLTLRDSNILGLKATQFTGSRMDLAKKHVEWDFFVPRIEIVGGYKAAGKILVLPIVGNGLGNITLLNMNITYKFDYKLDRIKGEDYVRITTAKLKFDSTRMYIRMENLFNGDRLLGEAMHQFLDQNWKEVLAELGPSVGDAIGTVFKLIFTNVASSVPFRHIFLT
ncbi:protein takeout-like [Macrosteles quadrilineatus]|uniref:protein takeout-like n=1 Tax=Macrosteles quadrilineatus TaxID=74068 RepID=UPI0023E2B491|nr:protein takeout-like [Macrosteles quadrilineatus]